MFIAGGSLKVRVSDATKISARDAIDAALGEGYIVAQNQIANSPEWLEKSAPNPCSSAWTCAAACISPCK